MFSIFIGMLIKVLKGSKIALNGFLVFKAKRAKKLYLCFES